MAYQRGWNREYTAEGFTWKGGPRELLAERRDKRRWTAQQLADQVQVKTDLVVSAREISMFEVGQMTPTPQQMEALAIAMDLGADWFVGSEGE